MESKVGRNPVVDFSDPVICTEQVDVTFSGIPWFFRDVRTNDRAVTFTRHRNVSRRAVSCVSTQSRS